MSSNSSSTPNDVAHLLTVIDALQSQVRSLERRVAYVEEIQRQHAQQYVSPLSPPPTHVHAIPPLPPFTTTITTTTAPQQQPQQHSPPVREIMSNPPQGCLSLSLSTGQKRFSFVFHSYEIFSSRFLHCDECWLTSYSKASPTSL